MKTDHFTKAIMTIFTARDELQKVFPKRKFTPDGRMVGDIGEAIAELYYEVTVHDISRKHWDGDRLSSNGKSRMVQIKATQKDYTYLKKPPHDGDLLVFQIAPDGSWSCAYNGPILRVWDSLSRLKANKIGEIIFGMKALAMLDETVSSTKRIPMRKK